MTEKDSFEDRIARIEASKGPPPPRATPRPVPAGARVSGPLFGIGAPKLIGYGLTLAVALGAMKFIADNPMTPLAAVKEHNPEGSRMHTCMNDPKLLAKLEAQGHTNLEYAAMLMCG